MIPVTNQVTHGMAYIQDILNNLVLPIFWSGGEKTVNLLPDHPLPNTKYHTIYLFNIPLIISEKPFLLILSTLPSSTNHTTLLVHTAHIYIQLNLNHYITSTNSHPTPWTHYCDYCGHFLLLK
jgi:hypothetical protein